MEKVKKFQKGKIPKNDPHIFIPRVQYKTMYTKNLSLKRTVYSVDFYVTKKLNKFSTEVVELTFEVLFVLSNDVKITGLFKSLYHPQVIHKQIIAFF